MPIVHDLAATHFRRINLDWIPREENQVADQVSKIAAAFAVGATSRNPDLFTIDFNQMDALPLDLGKRKKK